MEQSLSVVTTVKPKEIFRQVRLLVFVSDAVVGANYPCLGV